MVLGDKDLLWLNGLHRLAQLTEELAAEDIGLPNLTAVGMEAVVRVDRSGLVDAEPVDV